MSFGCLNLIFVPVPALPRSTVHHLPRFRPSPTLPLFFSCLTPNRLYILLAPLPATISPPEYRPSLAELSHLIVDPGSHGDTLSHHYCSQPCQQRQPNQTPAYMHLITITWSDHGSHSRFGLLQIRGRPDSIAMLPIVAPSTDSDPPRTMTLFKTSERKLAYRKSCQCRNSTNHRN